MRFWAIKIMAGPHHSRNLFTILRMFKKKRKRWANCEKCREKFGRLIINHWNQKQCANSQSGLSAHGPVVRWDRLKTKLCETDNFIYSSGLAKGSYLQIFSCTGARITELVVIGNQSAPQTSLAVIPHYSKRMCSSALCRLYWSRADMAASQTTVVRKLNVDPFCDWARDNSCASLANSYQQRAWSTAECQLGNKTTCEI